MEPQCDRLADLSGAWWQALRRMPPYFWLLQRIEAYQVATVQWIEPLVAIIETAFFLRVGLSFSMIAGSLVTLVCLSVSDAGTSRG